jgi:ATP-dependent Clp protease ATP-binding subunit ClpA
MRQNPDIDAIIANACAIAKDYKHEYVTLEHTLISLVEFGNFNQLLVDFGVDVENLLRDLYDYIGKQDHLVNLEKEKLSPQKTSPLGFLILLSELFGNPPLIKTSFPDFSTTAPSA